MEDILLVTAVVWALYFIARLAPYVGTLGQTASGQITVALILIALGAAFCNARIRKAIRLAALSAIDFIGAAVSVDWKSRLGWAAFFIVAASACAMATEPMKSISDFLLLELLVGVMYSWFRRRSHG